MKGAITKYHFRRDGRAFDRKRFDCAVPAFHIKNSSQKLVFMKFLWSTDCGYLLKLLFTRRGERTSGTLPPAR